MAHLVAARPRTSHNTRPRLLAGAPFGVGAVTFAGLGLYSWLDAAAYVRSGGITNDLNGINLLGYDVAVVCGFVVSFMLIFGVRHLLAPRSAAAHWSHRTSYLGALSWLTGLLPWVTLPLGGLTASNPRLGLLGVSAWMLAGVYLILASSFLLVGLVMPSSRTPTACPYWVTWVPPNLLVLVATALLTASAIN